MPSDFLTMCLSRYHSLSMTPVPYKFSFSLLIQFFSPNGAHASGKTNVTH